MRNPEIKVYMCESSVVYDLKSKPNSPLFLTQIDGYPVCAAFNDGETPRTIVGMGLSKDAVDEMRMKLATLFEFK